MKALTAAEMREVDRLTTERYGVPSLDLMENAGKHVAHFVRKAANWSFFGRPLRVAVLCGKGNNGGDGLVVARLLAKDEGSFDVRVVLLAAATELQGDAATNYQRYADAGGRVLAVESQRTWEEQARPFIAGTDLVVDALFGTGLRRGAAGVAAQAISDLNAISRNATASNPAMILAVDVPSGLPSDGEAPEGPVVRAHATITFTAPKVGQLVSKDAAACGALQVVGIGSPLSLIEEIGRGSLRWMAPDEFEGMSLVRAADSHKGTFGHVLLLAGSPGKSGAAVLAGYACLRAGAGLTTIACADAIQPVIAAAHPEYMTAPLAATKSGALGTRSLLDGTFDELEESKSVLALGPGLGTHRQTQEFVRTVVAHTDLPVVLDADGLNAFAANGALLRKRKTKFLCVTPHPGEMARVLGVSTASVQGDRLKAAAEAASKWKAHVILKGYHTLLAAPDGRVFVNSTGSPSLAKGGTGDVLTGVLAALTAQFGTDDWLRVLGLGVYLHGKAGDTQHLGSGSGLLAHEVADAIPLEREALLREMQSGV